MTAATIVIQRELRRYRETSESCFISLLVNRLSDRSACLRRSFMRGRYGAEKMGGEINLSGGAANEVQRLFGVKFTVKVDAEMQSSFQKFSGEIFHQRARGYPMSSHASSSENIVD